MSSQADVALAIVPRPYIGPDAPAGGGIVFYENLRALAAVFEEVLLLHLIPEVEERRGTHDSVADLVSGVVTVELPSKHPLSRRIVGRARTHLIGPRYTNPSAASLAVPVLRRLLRTAAPDLVWGEHFMGAQLLREVHGARRVYYHHDWLYRIKSLRGAVIGADAASFEAALARGVDGVACGSVVEAAEMRSLGVPEVLYMPVSYPTPPAAEFVAEPVLVHLGSLRTTAGFVGLTEFLDSAWPRIAEAGLSLKVVGEYDGGPADLVHRLRSDPSTELRGFRENLRDELAPGSIQIVPWAHSTGQRTRAVLGLAHGQVLVAMRAGVAGVDGLQDGHNCLLADSMDQLSELVLLAASDIHLRRLLSENARALFEAAFSREASAARLADFVERLGLRR